MSAWHFAKMTFYQFVKNDILSIWHFVNMTFCQYDILSMTFCQYGILSIWHSVNFTFIQLGIFSTRHFVNLSDIIGKCINVCLKNAKLAKSELSNDKKVSWSRYQNIKMKKWQVEKMTIWQNVKLAKRQVDNTA